VNDEILRLALNEIEKREMPLLSWGVTGGTLSETELEDLLRSIAPDDDVDDLIDGLIDRGLVVAKGVADQRYRSRMAETVRLAATLRQWFHGRDWSTAPSLASDMRFLSQPRVVPRRDRAATELADDLGAHLGADWTPRHDEAMNAVLAGRSVSSFQVRAMTRLVPHHNGPRATVITAGTGSGKTLAFYLPALTRLLATPRPAGVPRVLAIYPRVELLRDQLRTLLLTCRTIAVAGEVAPKVGILYGAVPRNRRDATSVRGRGWKQQGKGLICPILGCLEEGCGGDYVWPASSGDAELLVCDRCGFELTGDRLSFTRNGLQARPPAILFTTTEMLNRQLGSAAMRRLLVGDANRSPEFLLLDEVHTYAGTHGAQVANLLRRWRAEVAIPPHVVGLSATLTDPAGFFAELTGLGTSAVSVVGPEWHEMREVGREYFLVLRGDPASQTSLLSTTIQMAMVLRRMLDESPNRPSQGAFGSRLFVFTDDLDVTNRLHSQLEDAEGWRPGGVNRKPLGSLATLRASTGPDVRAREEAGQVWGFAEQIGTLHLPVRVSRTTSRDAGVDATADIVVATASLEVGFDDPNVGAVLQHKAPRDPAQFLQRRGRAGRDPLMRPWTVVVLSDYGRDRLAFQSYEALFDPVVQPTRLPLRNRVVQKMQATWWLLDYLSRFNSGASVPALIERPWEDRDRQREIAGRLLRVVRETLTESGIARVSAQLRRSLSLPDEDLRAVLWDHPRAVIAAVLATLVRRLEAVASSKLPDDFDWSSPLSEFLPSSLFSPLQTPEIRLAIPGRSLDGESEPVSQAMRQFAPGRVSYRYALGGRRERLWVAPPASLTPVLAIEEFCNAHIDLDPPPGGLVDRLVQPTSLRLATPPGSVSDSSYGRWNWHASFRHDGVPLTLDRPDGTPWSSQIVEFQALTHRYRCPQTVWRYARNFDVERNNSNEPPSTQHTVTVEGGTAGVGFVVDVDGLVLEVRLPRAVPTGPSLLRALRVARMDYLIRTSPRLSEAVPLVFTREWLHQVLLSVLVSYSNGRALTDVLTSSSDEQLRVRMIDAAREVFGASMVGAAAAAAPGGGPPDPGLVADLADAVNAPGVIAELRSAAAALWAEPDDGWLSWIQERYLTTLAASVVDAIQSSCPEVDTSDLRCDIDHVPSKGADVIGRIHICEDQPGGVGVIEAVVDRYVEDPRAFWALVTAALGPCDGERVDWNLRQFLDAIDVRPVAEAVERIRSATDLASLTIAWRDLRFAMFDLGVDGDQSIVSALATRIVRPGSNRDLELLVSDLLDQWDELESLLGIEVELRVFAHVGASNGDIRRRLHAAVQGQAGQSGWEIGQIVGLLWPRGYRLRAAALRTYSPYVQFEPSERLLFADITESRGRVADASSADWRGQVDHALRIDGSATIRARTEGIAAAAIRDLLTEPTSVDVLEFHPRVVGIARSATGLDVLVELREARQ
jgi:hypothetical protein